MEVDLEWPEASSVGHITVETDSGYLYGWVGERHVLARDLEERRLPRLARCIELGGWPAAYIDALNITKEERGRGAGHELLEAALRCLSEAGVRYVFLHASADRGWEQDLIRFYEDSGFRIMSGCQDNNVQPVLMRADLSKKSSRKS